MKTNRTKIALITGGNRGLGWVVANQLTLQGFQVYIGVRDIQRSAAAFDKFEKKERIHMLQIDMENPATFEQAYQTIEREAGYLDLLINNAGVMLDGDLMKDSTTTIDPAILRSTFSVNFFGVVLLTNQMLPLLLKSESPRIVNVSSQMGSLQLHAQKAIPAKTFAYNASKAALNAYTIHLANALEDQGIKVNAAHPGWMQTDMGGKYAPMTALEGAETILDLATLEQSGPTGKFLHKSQEIMW